MKGTVLIDESTGGYYNSPYFCGVCTNEKRDNQHLFLKGTWFLSTGALGSHNIVAGYDNFTGKELLNNYQSGSNYVVGSTAAIQQNGDLFPVFDSSSYILYFPITQQSAGSDVRTHAVFLNDQWRLTDRVSLSLGVRWDKNAAKDGGGVTRASDSSFSPRLGATWDVTGRGLLRVAASYAKYVGAIQETQVSSATQAGTPLLLYWYYDGPGATPINADPNGPLLTRAQAITQLFSWFQGQGCPNLSTCQVALGGAQVPGVNQQILGSLASPNAKEYTVGVQGNVGARASYRVDLVRREFGDFYSLRLDQSTGQVTDSFGNVYDLQIVGNTNDLERNYTALQAQFQVNRLFDALTVGAKLDVVAHARQLQRGDDGIRRRPRPAGLLPGIHAGELGSAPRRPRDGPAPSRPRVRVLGRPASARRRCPLPRRHPGVRHGDSLRRRGLGDRLAVRDEPGIRDASARDHLLLHVPRRVPDGQRLAHGPRAELRLQGRGHGRDLPAPAGHQRLQQPGRDRGGHDRALGGERARASRASTRSRRRPSGA